MNMITTNRELKGAIYDTARGFDFLDGVTVNTSYVDCTDLEQIITIEYNHNDNEGHHYANAIYTGMTSILSNTSMEVIRDYNITFSNFDEDTKWIRLSFKLNNRD